MRISDIRNIIVIAEFKNFNKASAYLHISQPALSQSVQRLENALGCQLFVRSRRSVALSRAGEEFVRDGMKILRIYDAMLENISQNTKKGEPIRIAASSVYARYYFPEIFKTFKQLHSEIELQMVEMDNKNRLQSLLNQEVDFAILKNQDISNIQHEHVFEEQLRFAASKELMERKMQYIYEKDGKEYVDLKGFEDVPFLNYPEKNGMHRATIDLCLEAGFLPNVIYETADPRLLTNLISCGMGVGFIASLSMIEWKESESVRFYRVDSPLMCRSYMLAWNTHVYLSQGKKDLIRIIQSIHEKQKHTD
ncbi:MAG: LysR family transcriptional regulator [Oscillospiraceae bacterium]|nr:LysR family transcriptional regulator [Oscillospiraceae bacterium]MBR3474777.1 LysR family transcriptional regulator [Oscillospiraceae bacterium]